MNIGISHITRMSERAKNLHYLMSKKRLPFHWRSSLLGELPRLGRAAETFKVWKDYRNLALSQLNLIGLFGLPRGGTNLLSAELHYHAKVFSVTERAQLPKYKIGFRLFLLLSTFGRAGLQDKKLGDIRYVVFNKMNTKTKDSARMWRPELVSSGRYKFIFLVRNPLRVAISLANKRRAKEHPYKPYGHEKFRSIVDQTAAMMGMYAETRDIDPNAAKLVVQERLCRDHETELRSIFRFIDEDLEPPGEGDLGRAFFKRAPCCKTVPEERDGWLACPSCGERIMGHGPFNPLTPVSFERAMHGQIDGSFSVDEVQYFKDAFGPELAAYWLRDADHRYEDDIPHAAVEGLKTRGGWSRVVANRGVYGLALPRPWESPSIVWESL